MWNVLRGAHEIMWETLQTILIGQNGLGTWSGSGLLLHGDFCYLCLHVPIHTCTHTHMQMRTHMTHHPMQVISEVTVTDIQQLSPTTKGFTLQAYNKELLFKPGQWWAWVVDSKTFQTFISYHLFLLLKFSLLPSSSSTQGGLEASWCWCGGRILHHFSSSPAERERDVQPGHPI